MTTTAVLAPAGQQVDATRPDSRLWRVLLGAVLLAAVAGQVRVWASDRGLWNDEIYLAVNLRDRSFVGLSGPLLYKQVAPPGWLIAEKVLFELFGSGEQILRLPQLVATVVLLCLTAYAAYRAVGRWGALLAASLIALSPLVYSYGAELKQYAPEATLAMVIMVAVGTYGGAAMREESVTRRQVIVFGAVVAGAVAGSYSALIVLAGAAAGMVVVLALQRRWRALTFAALASAPGFGIGVVQILLRRRYVFASNQYDIFPTGFPPTHSGPGELLRWLPNMWQGFTANPVMWRYPWFVLLLILAGSVALVIRGKQLWAAMVLGVFLVAIVAAAVRGLPLEGRIALYLIAPAVIAVVAAMDGAARALVLAARRGSTLTGRPVTWLVTGLAMILPGAVLAVAVKPAAAAAYREVADPRYRDDGRDMLREVAARLQPGDVVLAYDFSEPLMTWYGREFKLPMAGLATVTSRHKCQPGSVDKALFGAKRVWYVRGARFSRHPGDYSDRIIAELAKRGTITDASTRWRASSWTVVDLTAGPDTNPPRPSPDPAYECFTVTPVRRN